MDKFPTGTLAIYRLTMYFRDVGEKVTALSAKLSEFHRAIMCSSFIVIDVCHVCDSFRGFYE